MHVRDTFGVGEASRAHEGRGRVWLGAQWRKGVPAGCFLGAIHDERVRERVPRAGVPAPTRSHEVPRDAPARSPPRAGARSRTTRPRVLAPTHLRAHAPARPREVPHDAPAEVTNGRGGNAGLSTAMNTVTMPVQATEPAQKGGGSASMRAPSGDVQVRSPVSGSLAGVQRVS